MDKQKVKKAKMLYRRLLSLNKVAKSMGISVYHVRKLLQSDKKFYAKNVTSNVRRTPKPKKALVEKAKKLYLEYRDLHQVGKKLGVSSRIVSRWLSTDKAFHDKYVIPYYKRKVKVEKPKKYEVDNESKVIKGKDKCYGFTNKKVLEELDKIPEIKKKIDKIKTHVEESPIPEICIEKEPEKSPRPLSKQITIDAFIVVLLGILYYISVYLFGFFK